jgi:hypothetical protein
MDLDGTLGDAMEFGTSVFEGLKEADTDFARAVLTKYVNEQWVLST